MKQVVLAALIVVGVAACASPSFQDVQLGMSKQQVVGTAGKPHAVIAAYQTDGKTIEVIEYRHDNRWWGDLEDPYWFYFSNDSLVKWDRPGDRLRYADME